MTPDDLPVPDLDPDDEDDAVESEAMAFPGALPPSDDPFAALMGGGGPGGIDFGAILQQAGEVQAQLAAAQEQAAATVVEGAAGGGAVRIAVTGGFEFRSVSIRPDAVDPDDVEMLQDLVLAALNDAIAQVQELQSSGLDLGGLDLGGLLGGG